MARHWGLCHKPGFSGGSAGDRFEGVQSLFPNPNILRRLLKYQEEPRTFQAKSDACRNVLFPVYHSVKSPSKVLSYVHRVQYEIISATALFLALRMYSHENELVFLSVGRSF